MMKQINQKSNTAKRVFPSFSSRLSLEEMTALKGGQGDTDDDIIIEEIIEG